MLKTILKKRYNIQWGSLVMAHMKTFCDVLILKAFWICTKGRIRKDNTFARTLFYIYQYLKNANLQ